MKKIAVVIRNMDEVKFGIANNIEDVEGYGFQIYIKLFEIEEEIFDKIIELAADYEDDAEFIEAQLNELGVKLYDSLDDPTNEDPLDPENIRRKLERHAFKESRGQIIDVTIDPLHKHGLTENDMVDMLMTVDKSITELYSQGVHVTKEDAIEMYEALRLVKYIQLMLKKGMTMREIDETIEWEATTNE